MIDMKEINLIQYSPEKKTVDFEEEDIQVPENDFKIHSMKYNEDVHTVNNSESEVPVDLSNYDAISLNNYENIPVVVNEHDVILVQSDASLTEKEQKWLNKILIHYTRESFDLVSSRSKLFSSKYRPSASEWYEFTDKCYRLGLL